MASSCRVGKIACRIVPMWATRAFTPVFDGRWRARDFAYADDSRHAPLPTLRRVVQARVPSGRQAVTFFMFIGNRSALARRHASRSEHANAAIVLVNGRRAWRLAYAMFGAIRLRAALSR